MQTWVCPPRFVGDKWNKICPYFGITWVFSRKYIVFIFDFSLEEAILLMQLFDMFIQTQTHFEKTFEQI